MEKSINRAMGPVGAQYKQDAWELMNLSAQMDSPVPRRKCSPRATSPTAASPMSSHNPSFPMLAGLLLLPLVPKGQK